MPDDTTAEARLIYPVETPPRPGGAVELAEGVLWLRLPLPTVLDHVNVYAFADPEGWTIVDTGANSRGCREGWMSALSGPLADRPVHRVLVTHHHPDHIGLAGWFQTDHGAELWTTRTAWLFARMLHLDNQDRPPPETLAFWRAAGMALEILAQRATERPFNFADAVAPMPLGFRRIKDGDRTHFGGRNWVVRCGNGHAPEQATLWSLDDDLVIGGDQLLPSISPNIGVYATEPDADPLTDWLASCAQFQEIAEDRHLVLPGHKLPFRGLPLRLDQLIDNHHGALIRLIPFLAEPRTAVDCFQTLFRREIGAGEYGLALVEAVAHLNHLLGQDRVTRTRRDDGAWLWRAA
ncbi:MAG: MBL fold metallo-hydrolase [Pseudomonadota bacterium]